MTQYFLHPETDLFQPDRRHNGHTKASGATDHRDSKHQPLRITSEQFAFLRDCLVRREGTRAAIAKSERRARHLLVFSAVFFVGLLFTARDFHLNLSLFGIAHELTFLELSAIAPLLLTYLVVHATHLAATNLRLDQQCRVIDLELRRFGGETSYGALRRFKRDCEQEPAKWEKLVAWKLYHGLFWIHDFFLAVSVLLAFAGCWYIVGQSAPELNRLQPGMAVTLLGYIGLTTLIAVASPIIFLYVRKKKDKVLEEYLAKHDRLTPRQGITHPSSGGS